MAAARPEHLRRDAPAAGRPAAAVLPGLPSALRGLADRLDTLEPCQVIGELEALKFALWTAAMPAPVPPADPVVPPTLNTRAAARVLGISPTGLRRLVAAGEVPVVRFGRRITFRQETLERIRAEREHGQGR